MVSYCLARGIQLPPGAFPGPGARPLPHRHALLARRVAPALPSTILAVAEQRRRRWSFGTVPLVRQLSLVAIVVLACLVLLGATKTVSNGASSGNLFEEWGLAALVNQGFLLLCGLLGASFHGLFLANRHVSAGTYDARYEASYWLRLVLGMIAGFLLSFVEAADQASALRGVSRPLLGLLGGFSATLVHRVLARCVDAVESLVRGDIESRGKARIETLTAQRDAELAEARVRMASTLLRLRAIVADQPDAELEGQLDGILAELLPNGLGGSPRLATERHEGGRDSPWIHPPGSDVAPAGADVISHSE